MNFLQDVIDISLPYIICILELMGVFVIVRASLISFFNYIQNVFFKKRIDIRNNLARGLVMGLEFEMAAEILKTILVQSLEEIYILGGIIILRIALSLLIHFENRPHSKHKDQE